MNEAWKNSEAPVQLHCNECDALYITDATMDNSCPVCLGNYFDILGKIENIEINYDTDEVKVEYTG